MKILVIEDETKTAGYLRKGLAESGFTVDVAEDGEDGLYLARTGDHDLIILDVMLPGRDGWSVLTELRRFVITEETCLYCRQGEGPEESALSTTTKRWTRLSSLRRS